MKKNRHHIYVTEADQSRIEEAVQGDLSPYYRHSVLHRLSLVEHAKSEIKHALGEELYGRLFSILLHAMQPLVKTGEEGEPLPIPDHPYTLVSSRLAAAKPKTVNDEEWQEVVDAMGAYALELLIIADEFWNAKQMKMVMEVAVESN